MRTVCERCGAEVAHTWGPCSACGLPRERYYVDGTDSELAEELAGPEYAALVIDREGRPDPESVNQHKPYIIAACKRLEDARLICDALNGGNSDSASER